VSSVRPSTGTIKKEGSRVSSTSATPVAAVKDAKSDSSFFSAPKPKPKLPSFKKAPAPPPGSSAAGVPQVKKEDLNVAQPSSIDPFQEALKSMAKARSKGSPAVPTPPPPLSGNGSANSSGSTTVATSTSSDNGLTKNGKRKKSVTWAPEGKLESIRLIERAIYDDDPVDGTYTSHSLRDLDRDEGAALHAHLFEETVDWSEPLLLEIPREADQRPRGEESQEKLTQEQREQTALGALYMSPAHIPESPGEPTYLLSEDEVDKDVRVMTSGPEVDAVFWSGPPIMPMPQLPNSVAELVGQLAATTGVGDAMAVDPNVTLQTMQSLPPEQLHALLQQLQNFPPAQPQAQQHLYDGGADQQSWNMGNDANSNHYGPSYGQGYHDNSNSHQDRWDGSGGSSRGGRGTRGGFRGRGRGRGGPPGDDGGGYRHNKRKPCSFFAAGRCKYGDQCDFAHEIFS